MSAAVTELHLNGKSPLRRILNIRANTQGDLSAAVYPIAPRGNPVPMIAYVSGPIARSRLRMVQKGYSDVCLWINGTAFDVSIAEAQKIRDTFEPLGLRIETEQSSLPGADLARVATSAAEVHS